MCSAIRPVPHEEGLPVSAPPLIPVLHEGKDLQTETDNLVENKVDPTYVIK